MKAKLPAVTRYLLGLIYFLFGLNGFLNFIPPPPTMPEGALAFINGMMSTGFFFPFLKGTEVTCGLMLLAGIAPPLALIILAPVTIQIILFHAFLTPGMQNQIMPIVMLALQCIAASAYWKVYRPLFSKG